MNSGKGLHLLNLLCICMSSHPSNYNCLSLISVAEINTLTKGNLKRKGLFGFRIPITGNHWGTSGQQLNQQRQEPDCSLDCSWQACFLIQLRTTCPCVGPPTSVINWESVGPTDLPAVTSSRLTVSQLSFWSFFPDNSSLCQLDKQTSWPNWHLIVSQSCPKCLLPFRSLPCSLCLVIPLVLAFWFWLCFVLSFIWEVCTFRWF